MTRIILCCLAAFLMLPAALAPAPAQAQPLPHVDSLDDLHRASSSHAVVTMTVSKVRLTRELTLEEWSKRRDHALIVIWEPAREAGTDTLRTEEGVGGS